jgi:FkbM family methyltransferase
LEKGVSSLENLNNSSTKKLKERLRKLMPKRISSKRILGGSLKGHRLVTSWYDYPAAILGYTEKPLLKWFEQNVKPGETWLDIGAHYGYTALALSKLVGAEGRVFAFEPMLSTVGFLAQTRSQNKLTQLTIVPLGLATPETVVLESLPTVRGMIDSVNGKPEWSETILIARLDWLWCQLCGEENRIHGVKIDVQGMEIEVIKGMRELLKNNKSKLVVEVHPGVDRERLLTLIREIGYSDVATPIEPVGNEQVAKYFDDKSYAFHPI